MLINLDGLSLLSVSSRRFNRQSSQKVLAAAGLEVSEVCLRFQK
jgi:hypothetical protein